MIGIFSQQCYHIWTTGLTDSFSMNTTSKKFPDFIFQDHWAHRFFFYEYMFKIFPDFFFGTTGLTDSFSINTSSNIFRGPENKSQEIF